MPGLRKDCMNCNPGAERHKSASTLSMEASIEIPRVGESNAFAYPWDGEVRVFITGRREYQFS